MNPEMSAALVGAVAGAVIGVLGTYIFDVRRAEKQRSDRLDDQERERRRHRETVATALLQDLRRTEFDFREIYDDNQPSRFALVRPSLLYDDLRPEIRWFKPASVQSIAELFRRVDHVYCGIAAVRAASASGIRSTPQREYEIRTHAAFALQALPEAVAALISEGGIMPGPMSWPTVSFPTLPEVQQPIFDDAAARLALREARPGG